VNNILMVGAGQSGVSSRIHRHSAAMDMDATIRHELR
jgi:hypothetical protein